jgi:probable rRNA maturation factor
VIYFHNDVKKSGIDVRRLKSVARVLLSAVDEAESALSLSLVHDNRIQELNREHRGKDKPTDVLSFPLNPSDFGDPTSLTGAPTSMSARPPRAKPVGSPNPSKNQPERLLGDVVISVDTARRQAAEYDAPLQNEVYRLLIHGLLHVMGHDHEEAAERAVMEAEERRLAGAIGMPWPYDDHASA